MRHSKLSRGFASLWKALKTSVSRFWYQKHSEEGGVAWDTELTREDEASIISLQNHQGFHALMGKFELQKRSLERTLKESRHTDIRAVDNLQAGIRWIEWIQREVSKQIRPAKINFYEDGRDLDDVVRNAVEIIRPQA